MDSPPTKTQHLIHAWTGQERQFARAFAILEEGIRRGAFPGAAVAITWQGRLIAHKAVGRFTYELNSPAVQAWTRYDLASVTKVVATTAVAMVLFDQGLLHLEMPLVQIVPEFEVPADPRRREVTLRMLLAHSSGLPAYVRLFEQFHGPDELLLAACRLPLEAAPDTCAAYSDIGFVLLGETFGGWPASRWITFASATFFSRWEWCTPAFVRGGSAAATSRLPRRTSLSASAWCRARCKTKMPPYSVALQRMPACLLRPWTWPYLPRVCCMVAHRFCGGKPWISSRAG